MHVTRARGHVDDQVVEVAPVGLAQQLLQRLHHQRTTPDHRLVHVDEKADGADLHAVVLHGLHGLAVGRVRPAMDAEHDGLRRAVDVGVKHADGGALGGQRQRQVGRHGALAHTALAGSHGDDVAHLRQQLHAALHRVGDDLLIDVGGDALHARDLLDGGLHRLADGIDLAERRIAQLHVQAHVTVVHPHVAGRAAGEEIPAGIGINDGGQRLIDGVDSNNTHDGIGYRNSVKWGGAGCSRLAAHGYASPQEGGGSRRIPAGRVPGLCIMLARLVPGKLDIRHVDTWPVAAMPRPVHRLTGGGQDWAAPQRSRPGCCPSGDDTPPYRQIGRPC